MIPRKQMVLKARDTYPVCRSARLSPINKTIEGNTKMLCQSCGYRFDVLTEVK